MMEGIWDVVYFVARALHQADADVLSCAQLLESMQKQEWYPVFCQSLQDFHGSRYPLSKIGLESELPEMA
jgi:DNA polymerase III epsilon subunit-like protein